MVEVKLYGELRRRYGHVHKFDIRSPAEALRALIANFPGFEADMSGAHQRGIGYKVIVGDTALEAAEQLRNPSGRSTIKISPRLLGAKQGGVAQILIGVVLVAIAIWAPYLLPAAGSVFSPAMVGALGFSLALGGVIQLLSPQPKGLDLKEQPGNNPSYMFNGPVNTSAQGHPVPVGYGELVVGSAVISAGVIAQDIPV